MRLVFDRDTLLSSLEKICSIANGKTTFAILSSFLIEVKDGKCSFTATDLSDTMRLSVDAQTDEDGAFLLKAKESLEIIKGLPKGEITLELLSNAIKISCGKFKASLNVSDITEFPKVTISDITSGLKFNSSELKSALGNVAQFASAENARPEFCGVHLEYKFGDKKDAVVTMVATDGHRLAKAELISEDVNAGDPNPDGYIISTKAVIMLAKFFAEEDSILFALEKKKSDNKAIFKGDKITITTSLIAGRYPDFSAVVPDADKNIVVDKNAMMASLKRSALINNKQLVTRIELSKDNINVCSSGQMGSMSDDVECKYDGETVVIGVNPKYLNESLSIVDDSFAVIGVIDCDSPIRIMSETDFDAKNFGTLSVVMPMQI